MALRIVTTLMALLLWVTTSAQQEISEELLDQDPQSLEVDENIETWLDQWHHRFPSLLNLNKITSDILAEIPWVTPIQARSLLRYIESNGPLISILELQAVPGWDLATIRLFEPLVFVKEKELTHDLRGIGEKLLTGRNKYLLFRIKNQIEKAQGYRVPEHHRKFQGSATAIMSRLRLYKSGDFGIGLTVDKDAGEPWRWNRRRKQWGADFWSFHLLFENKGPVRRLLFGDYQVQWDQSLIMGMGLNLGNQVITGIRKAHRGIYAHTSVSESKFRRGAGLELKLGKFMLSGFYSLLYHDALLKPADSVNGTPTHATSVQLSGLHRNQNEIDTKNKLPIEESGVHLAFPHLGTLKLSVSGVYQTWRWPLIPSPRKYNTFYFRGKYNYNLGISVQSTWENMHVFGQWAISKSGGKGLLLGIVASLSPQVSLAMGTRDYQRHFHSIAGSAMGVNSANINERGVYWGLQLTPHLKWNISGYLDLFRFPWLTFKADVPAQGYGSLIRLQYLHQKNSRAELQWRINSNKINDQDGPNQTNGLIDRVKHLLILKAQWVSPEKCTIKSRLQWSTISTGHQQTTGFLINHEIIASAASLQLTLGNTLFNTEDYDNRQYIYERDLLYSLSLPAFDGLGSRWYFLCKARISKKLICWTRFARTLYSDRSQIGSGLDAVTGAAKSDYRFQLQYKL